MDSFMQILFGHIKSSCFQSKCKVNPYYFQDIHNLAKSGFCNSAQARVSEQQIHAILEISTQPENIFAENKTLIQSTNSDGDLQVYRHTGSNIHSWTS